MQKKYRQSVSDGRIHKLLTGLIQKGHLITLLGSELGGQGSIAFPFITNVPRVALLGTTRTFSGGLTGETGSNPTAGLVEARMKTQLVQDCTAW